MFSSTEHLTVMFVSHFLATREVEADHGTEANEGREVEDKEKVLRHVATGIQIQALRSYLGLYSLIYTGC